ncbi:MAG: hypothetical protein LLF76_08010 [Planctomycetaceae bacterium]|nr:hypothetical protein [Planctomycetaceae bacterium]
MNAFNPASIKELLEYENKPCVSLYMPAAEKGTDTRQSPVRLKNLLAQAQEQLIVNYADQQKNMADEFSQAHGLVDNSLFWLHQKKGFVLFMAPGLFRYYRVHIPLKIRCTVGNAFNIKPLLALFTQKDRYYILALSQKSVRFYEAAAGDIAEREIPGLMRSIEELQKYEVREKQLQLYVMPTVPGTGVVGHGHATDMDGKEIKKHVSEFVKNVVSDVENYLQADRTPVLLCAEPFMHYLVTEHKPGFELMKEAVLVNPTHLDAEQILQRSGDIIQKNLADRTRTTLDRLAALMDTGWTIQNAEEIIPRAEEGRIETLFIDPDQPVWGFWNRDGGLIQIHEQPLDTDQDLSDLAVLQTLLHGGQVYAVPTGAIRPGSMAAILRY